MDIFEQAFCDAVLKELIKLNKTLTEIKNNGLIITTASDDYVNIKKYDPLD